MRQEYAPNGKLPREYPAELVRRVVALYESGMSIGAVQDAIGPGIKVQLVLHRYGAQMRTSGPNMRDQRGEANSSWKGADAGYQAFHLRVQSVRGKPSWCVACETTDATRNYEWANLTRRYDDVHDYIRLCVPCHRKFDADTRRRSKGGDANV